VIAGSRHEQRCLGPQWPEFAWCGLPVGVPAVVSGQGQMLPAERRHVAHHLGAKAELGSRDLEVAGVPEDHGGDEEIQAGRPVDLVFEVAVAHFAKLAEEQSPGERIAGLTLVQSALRTPPKVDVADPLQHEQASLEATGLAQRDRQAVLTGVGGQLAEHRRGGHRARANGGRKPQQLVPVRRDVVDLDRRVDHRREEWIDRSAWGQVQLALLQVTFRSHLAYMNRTFVQ
jgi:hypothetical protein